MVPCARLDARRSVPGAEEEYYSADFTAQERQQGLHRAVLNFVSGWAWGGARRGRAGGRGAGRAAAAAHAWCCPVWICLQLLNASCVPDLLLQAAESMSQRGTSKRIGSSAGLVAAGASSSSMGGAAAAAPDPGELSEAGAIQLCQER